MKKLKVYYPQPKFPAVSISGSKCILKCRHCNGFYLKNMLCADTVEKFIKLCRRLADKGTIGLLISGGYDKKGGLLNLNKIARALRKIKKETNLIINLHSGFVDRNILDGLADCIDIASVDIAGMRQIKEVFGLNKTPQDYLENIKLIKSYGIAVVPHLCIGFGEESRCLELLKELKPEIIVFIGFRQTEGAELDNFKEPKPKDWKNVIAYAKKIFPKAELALGCMRSRKNKEKVEMAALKAGVTRIVLPSKKTLEFASANNYKIKKFESCCALSERFEALVSP